MHKKVADAKLILDLMEAGPAYVYTLLIQTNATFWRVK